MITGTDYWKKNMLFVYRCGWTFFSLEIQTKEGTFSGGKSSWSSVWLCLYPCVCVCYYGFWVEVYIVTYVCYLVFIHSFILVKDDGPLLMSKLSNIRLYLVL